MIELLLFYRFAAFYVDLSMAMKFLILKRSLLTHGSMLQWDMMHKVWYLFF